MSRPEDEERCAVWHEVHFVSSAYRTRDVAHLLDMVLRPCATSDPYLAGAMWLRPCWSVDAGPTGYRLLCRQRDYPDLQSETAILACQFEVT